MKHLILILLTTHFIISCKERVEVPSNHIGVLEKDDRIQKKILRTGIYNIENDYKLVLFEIGKYEKLNITFDFMFYDLKEGKIKLNLKFVPIEDSLSSFYERYQTIHVIDVVNAKTRQFVREFFINENSYKYSKDKIERSIDSLILNNRIISSYVEFKNIDAKFLEYK